MPTKHEYKIINRPLSQARTKLKILFLNLKIKARETSRTMPVRMNGVILKPCNVGKRKKK